MSIIHVSEILPTTRWQTPLIQRGGGSSDAAYAIADRATHGVALGFIMKEQREAASVPPPAAPRVETLKLNVNKYEGKEGAPLRWLVELDAAVAARRIVDPLSKPAFAMSSHGGRARSWAYGRRLADPTCFSTYEVFKEELRQALEPPQNDFLSRAEFFYLQQGKHDVHAYAQKARYLISNIVTNPMDEATMVVTFMEGLRDGPVKTYLFREYPMRKRRTDVGPMSNASAAEALVTLHGSVRHLYSIRRAVVVVQGTTADNKKRRQPVGAGRPTGMAVMRVHIGYATIRTAALNEKESHCNDQDYKPNLVILASSTRASSLRALVDSGASNNFVRLRTVFPMLEMFCGIPQDRGSACHKLAYTVPAVIPTPVWAWTRSYSDATGGNSTEMAARCL
ncbi:unnamed protein product [Phytophthora lilii]|uniref:Unnamed protein product n=1 Tax=Phytophthora lilii TaxID=2077276 RepID=A0A9W6TSW6_9STRA|nr:unnamed protein product [Phytophthora lilii]